MSKLDISVDKIELNKIFISQIDKNEEEPCNYISLEYNLLTQADKKVGDYKIESDYTGETQIPEPVKKAMLHLIDELEVWGAQEALNELKLIEAPNGELNDE